MENARSLDDLPAGQPARIAAVDWSRLAVGDGKRLMALGIDAGAEVSISHRGMFGAREPIALRVGRMTVALRRIHAEAISVEA